MNPQPPPRQRSSASDNPVEELIDQAGEWAIEVFVETASSAASSVGDRLANLPLDF